MEEAPLEVVERGSRLYPPQPCLEVVHSLAGGRSGEPYEELLEGLDLLLVLLLAEPLDREAGAVLRIGVTRLSPLRVVLQEQVVEREAIRKAAEGVP